jgi:predicted DCC family thiol-disulfide oxidoreductase YuxK
VPAQHYEGETDSIVTLAHLDNLDLRQAEDGCHGLWHVDGATHQFWLPNVEADAAAFYAFSLHSDRFFELRAHAARRFWRSLNHRPPGRAFHTMPAQLRQFHIMSLRALDAKLRDESYRSIAKVLLGFQGTKEDWESDPRKNKARRLVAHGLKMMRGGYRLLLHYPIKPRTG